MHDEIDHEASRAEKKADMPGKKYPVYDPNNRRLILPDA
jgi:hypothetical protein